MKCYLCEGPAAGACTSCGCFYCSAHGKGWCLACQRRGRSRGTLVGGGIALVGGFGFLLLGYALLDTLGVVLMPIAGLFVIVGAILCWAGLA